MTIPIFSVPLEYNIFHIRIGVLLISVKIPKPKHCQPILSHQKRILGI